MSEARCAYCGHDEADHHDPPLVDNLNAATWGEKVWCTGGAECGCTGYRPPDSPPTPDEAA